jgi:hypothetical protein
LALPVGDITLDHTGKLLYGSGSSIHGYRIAWNGQLIPTAIGFFADRTSNSRRNENRIFRS